MKMLAVQDTFIPTNKMLASHITAIILYQFGMDFAPLPPDILESYRFIISYTVGGVIGWFVPDFLNFPRGYKDAQEK